MKVTYFHNAIGYAIKAVDKDGGEYSIICGNHVGESAGFVPPSSDAALKPRKIREFCKQTLANEFPGIKAKRDAALAVDIALYREAMK